MPIEPVRSFDNTRSTFQRLEYERERLVQARFERAVAERAQLQQTLANGHDRRVQRGRVESELRVERSLQQRQAIRDQAEQVQSQRDSARADAQRSTTERQEQAREAARTEEQQARSQQLGEDQQKNAEVQRIEDERLRAETLRNDEFERDNVAQFEEKRAESEQLRAQDLERASGVRETERGEATARRDLDGTGRTSDRIDPSATRDNFLNADRARVDAVRAYRAESERVQANIDVPRVQTAPIEPRTLSPAASFGDPFTQLGTSRIDRIALSPAALGLATG